MRIGLTTLVVHEYDEAIRFYVDAVGFTLVTDDDMGGGKRWVVVAPPGGDAALLLASAPSATSKRPRSGGRPVAASATSCSPPTSTGGPRMTAAGVTFLEAPRDEVYGKVVVWQDLYGNRWDLLENRR